MIFDKDTLESDAFIRLRAEAVAAVRGKAVPDYGTLLHESPESLDLDGIFKYARVELACAREGTTPFSDREFSDPTFVEYQAATAIADGAIAALEAQMILTESVQGDVNSAFTAYQLAQEQFREAQEWYENIAGPSTELRSLERRALGLYDLAKCLLSERGVKFKEN